MPKGEIIVDYRSAMPMIASDFGEFVINCRISTDAFDYGGRDGKARGMGLLLLNETVTEFTLSWRNVLTILAERFVQTQMNCGCLRNVVVSRIVQRRVFASSA